MALLEMKYLGGLSLQLDSKPLTELKSAKGRALLCYLAVSQKQVPRPLLAALFWSDMPENKALMNLRQVLIRLKPLTSYLLVTRDTVSFNRDAAAWLDVAEFEKDTATSTLLSTGVPQNIPRLQNAITLYQGDFLAGFLVSNAPLFEEWVLAQRARLREAVLRALQQLVKHFRAEGANETAVAYGRQLLAIEPWHEETHRELMRILARSGQRSAALTQYENCRQLLADELGVPPTTATNQLYEQIKAGEWSHSPPPPLPTAPPHNLPPQMTPFVGREFELMQLQKLLSNPNIHLITILGPGGMGKSRLALTFATHLLHNQQTHLFPDGIYFVSLARLEAADLLVTAVAEAINFRFAEGNDFQKQLLRYLAPKTMLLLLDNFEHLLAGAGLVDAILQTAPKIKIIVTSRVRLNRRIEQLFPLVGLAFPQEETTSTQDIDSKVTTYSAVALFVQCARRIQPGFALTAANQTYVLDICRLLQGMPLGIVLAATWLETLSPRAISREMHRDIDFLATEMEDVPRRQRSLRAAFNHSWRLLSQHEQEIFSQMSIFQGGFMRAAAQGVTGATLRDLQALVNKSLLMLSPNRRYEVHELLRQFAAEKLHAMVDLETGVRNHHSIYYCSILHQQTPNWRNAHQLAALAAVKQEADNIQRGWRWALQQGAWQRLSEAIHSWGWYHKWQAYRIEGEAFCQVVIEQVSRNVTVESEAHLEGLRLQAKAQSWYGEFAAANHVAVERLQECLLVLELLTELGQDVRQEKVTTLLALKHRFFRLNRTQARQALKECLRLCYELEDSWGVAVCLGELGHLDWAIGHYALARQRLEESILILQREGDQLEEIGMLYALAWLKLHLGQLDEAERLRRRIIDLNQQLYLPQPYSAAALAYTLNWRGEFVEAIEWGEKGLALCREDQSGNATGFVSLAIGSSLLFTGQYESARSVLTQALTQIREGGGHGVEASVLSNLGYLALAELAYDEAQSAFEEGYRLYQAVQDNYIFLALSGLCFSTCCRGDLDQSRTYFIELLTSALKLKDFLYLLMALPGMALYLMRKGKSEQAITVWAHARCQPYVANSQMYADIVGQEMERATAVYPADLVTAAQKNGRTQDIWTMAKTVLADLQSEKLTSAV